MAVRQDSATARAKERGVFKPPPGNMEAGASVRRHRRGRPSRGLAEIEAELQAIERDAADVKTAPQAVATLERLADWIKLDKPSADPGADARTERCVAVEIAMMRRLADLPENSRSLMAARLKPALEFVDEECHGDIYADTVARRDLLKRVIADLEATPDAGADAELVRLCAEHPARIAAVNAGPDENEDGPSWAAYEASRSAIAMARPATLAGLLAKARAAKAEAASPDGIDRPDHCPAGSFAWDLVNDLLRLGEGAAPPPSLLQNDASLFALCADYHAKLAARLAIGDDDKAWDEACEIENQAEYAAMDAVPSTMAGLVEQAKLARTIISGMREPLSTEGWEEWDHEVGDRIINRLIAMGSDAGARKTLSPVFADVVPRYVSARQAWIVADERGLPVLNQAFRRLELAEQAVLLETPETTADALTLAAVALHELDVLHDLEQTDVLALRAELAMLAICRSLRVLDAAHGGALAAALGDWTDGLRNTVRQP